MVWHRVLRQSAFAAASFAGSDAGIAANIPRMLVFPVPAGFSGHGMVAALRSS
jgi:hypothetical protein